MFFEMAASKLDYFLTCVLARNKGAVSKQKKCPTHEIDDPSYKDCLFNLDEAMHY